MKCTGSVHGETSTDKNFNIITACLTDQMKDIEEPKKKKIIVEINYKLKKLKKLMKQEPEFKDILGIYQELENVDNINVVKTMGKIKKEDLIQHIRANEYEILKGKIH
ncbi:hypothetical protein [Persephonella sp.]